VCGAANNQLASDAVGPRLAERGVVYAPDYVANAGGVVQVGDEALHPVFDFDRAKAVAARIYDTTLHVLRTADADGMPPEVAAGRVAERRMADVGRLRSVLLPAR
jgi:valine dehydrogenase (NAD+)